MTLTFAGRARRAPEDAPLAAIAIVLASTIMFGRVLVEVGAVHAPLLRQVAPPIVAMAVGGLAAVAVLWRAARQRPATGTDVELQNPFELGTALKMGLLFACVLLVSKAAQTFAGARGMYLAAVLAGTTDVDAITLSTASLARDGLDPAVAATTVVLGAAANTAVKAGIAAVVGGAALSKRVAPACLAMIACGGAAIALSRL